VLALALALALLALLALAAREGPGSPTRGAPVHGARAAGELSSDVHRERLEGL